MKEVRKVMGNETAEAELGERMILVKVIRWKVLLMTFHIGH